MIIQSILTFTLGLLIAALIAVLIAPAFWNRAVRLTRRRLEATMPMSLNEIQAEKDRVRAEYAMTQRRVEIEAAAQQAKANERAVEIARLQEEIRNREKAAEAAAAVLAEREKMIAEKDTRLQEADAAIRAKEAELKAQQAVLEEREAALEDLSRLQEETSLISSNRQIDLLARDSDIDRLNNTIAQLRTQRADGEQKLRDQEAAAMKASEDLKSERRRIKDLERKNERLMSDLSDRDERLERREKLLQAKPGKKDAAADAEGTVARPLVILAALEEERDALRAERDALLQDAQSGGPAEGSPQAAALRAENTHLRETLRDAESREETLRMQLTEAQAAAMRLEAEIADSSTGSSAENRTATPASETAVLRDELAAMAAQMVLLTRTLEGPGSPIDAALAARQGTASSSGKPTLADRIRALQEAASAAEAAQPVKGDR